MVAKRLFAGAALEALKALVGAEEVLDMEAPKRLVVGADEVAPLPNMLLDGAEDAAEPLNRLLDGADGAGVLLKMFDGAEDVASPKAFLDGAEEASLPKRLADGVEEAVLPKRLLEGADDVEVPPKAFVGPEVVVPPKIVPVCGWEVPPEVLAEVELAKMFADGADEAVVPKMLDGAAVDVEAPNKPLLGALDAAEANMLLAGAAEEVEPKMLPEDAGGLAPNMLVEPEEVFAKTLFDDSEGLLANAFCCVEDGPNTFELGADGAVLPPKMLPEGADDEEPKILLDGAPADSALPNALFAGGAEARLPNGLLAPDGLLPNVKEEEKALLPALLLLFVAFCDANGFKAGPALKLKPPLGGAGANPPKALEPGCC